MNLLLSTRRLLVALLCVAQLGCTSMRNVPAGDAGVGAPSVQPGDTLRIQLRDGSSVALVVRALSTTALSGTDSDTAPQRSLELSDIVAIERRETDKLKTVLLVAAVVALLYGVAYAKALGKLVGTTP